MAKMVSRNSEIPEVEYIYPLERIALISSKLVGHILPLLNGFKEYYEALEVKPVDITTFKKNNYGKYGGINKNRSQSNFWKRKNRFRGKDIEKFITNAYVKQLPQNDEEKIKKIIISHLNKLNEKKFTIIVKEFIDHLEEQMFFETYNILNDEILNKVATDNHYVYLYARLAKELIINKKWQKKMFNIISSENGEEFYWSLNRLGQTQNENEYVGPFESEQEAIEDAMDHHNYKMSFCNFMQNKFSHREIYLNEIRETSDSFDLNIYAKNKYNNFLKLIFSTVEQGIFKIDLLHHILLILISSRELEQFSYFYEQLHVNAKYKLNSECHNFYENKLNEIITQTPISPKIKFKLQEFFKLKLKNANAFEALAILESNDSSENSEVVSSEVVSDRDITCIISEYPISQDYNTAKSLFKSISKNNYFEFSSSIISTILDGKESEGKLLLSLMFKLWDDFPDYCKSFGDFINESLINLFSEYEIDYPNSKELFATLIMKWLDTKTVERRSFIENLRSKKTDDEDEQYNIELFNEKIVVLL